MASTNQLDNTIYVGGLASLRFVAAANMTMNDGDTTHYRLRVSFVPANIGKIFGLLWGLQVLRTFVIADVWGWVKYYREPHEQKQNNNIKPTAKPASNRRPNEGQKMEKTGGLFEKKYLLENDTQLTLLAKQNMTLRKALALLNESVALGLLVENWSAYPLGKVSSGGKMQFYYSCLSVSNTKKARLGIIGIIPLPDTFLSITNSILFRSSDTGDYRG